MYHLAEWLNNHREACHRWPGNLLVKKLQDVWEDGVVNMEELQCVGRMLSEIHIVWARRKAPPKIYELKPPQIDLSRATLPSVNYKCQVESYSDPDTSYDISLDGPSCSCPDWRSRRSQLPARHLTRCCKHILGAFSQAAPKGGWPTWLGAFIEAGNAPHPKQEWFLEELNAKAILFSSAPQDWSNIFAPARTRYAKFGYNILEERWAYGDEPRNGRTVAKMIHARIR